MQPLVGAPHELRVHREARREHEARGLGRVAQAVERGPRPFGVHVVDRDRRDAAPVVDAGREQRREIVAQVRGRLEVHVGGQDQPGRRDRPEELVGGARLGAVHRGARLGQEVLHDHFLHVTVFEVRVRDRDERVDALGARLADADEDAGRERHTRAAGGVQRGEAAGRRLVGRAVVRAARLVQPVGERLDHHPLRRADRAQAGELGLGERARVGVGEQAGLVEHALRDRDEIVDGARRSRARAATRRLRVALLGRLAEGEQRLEAAESRRRARRAPAPVLGEVRRVEPGGRLGERAVAAAVAAQHRERHEHLGREGDPRARSARRGGPPRPASARSGARRAAPGTTRR